MENYCAFSKNHKCLNWTDYELTRYELEEAGSLCQANLRGENEGLAEARPL